MTFEIISQKDIDVYATVRERIAAKQTVQTRAE
jgi:hypothetical protein